MAIKACGQGKSGMTILEIENIKMLLAVDDV